jgi:hypothetical protein
MDIITNELGELFSAETSLHIVNEDENTDNSSPSSSQDPPDLEDPDVTRPRGPKLFSESLPRTKENRDNINVYVLLVGINHYPEGEDMPGRLDGCLNDVMKIEDYLIRKYSPGTTPLSFYKENEEFQETAIVPIDEGDPLPVTTSPNRLHICVLRDEQATYDNIIRAFQEHLQKAGGSDSVLFHFSGYGSSQFTADEFRTPRLDTDGSLSLPPLIPAGKDECLVVYQNDPSRPMFLATQEMAHLLQEVRNSSPTQDNEKTHIVVSLDCCCSGGGTRNSGIPGLKARVFGDFILSEGQIAADVAEDDAGEPSAARLSGQKKAITKYYGYEGYEPGYGLNIPSPQYLLLTACNASEDAWDTPEGGLFTNHLVKVLDDALEEEKDLDYTDLFKQLQAEVVGISKGMGMENDQVQNPKFDILGSFDPFTCFIEGWKHPDALPGRYEVFSREGDWYIGAGAIDGLPTRKTNVDVQESGMVQARVFDQNTDEFVCDALIENVGVQHSHFRFLLTEAPEGIGEEPWRPDIGHPYYAEVMAMPPQPLYVQLSGREEIVEALKDDLSWEPLRMKQLFVAGEEPEGEEPARISVHASGNGNIRISDLQASTDFIELYATFDGVVFSQEELVEKALLNLDLIASFIRMTELQNSNSQIADFFELEMHLMDSRDEVTIVKPAKVNEESGIEVPSPSPLRFPVQLENEKHDMKEAGKVEADNINGITYNFSVKVRDIQQDLFFYLFLLEANGRLSSLLQHEEDNHYRMAGGEELFLNPTADWLALLPEEEEKTYWFKVLATTQEMDYERLLRAPLSQVGEEQVEDNSGSPNQIPSDWAAYTFEVKLSNDPRLKEMP